MAAPTPSELERAKAPSANARVVSDAVRQDALARAQVWRDSRRPLAPHLFRVAPLDEMSCRFVVTRPGGTTPKFDCVLQTGEQVRVKYGNGSEIPSEAAATRLVRALGFAADTITLVRRLHCHGCPVEPFTTMKTLDVVRAGPLLARAVDYDQYRDFDWVAIERKYGGQPIETASRSGWSFQELDEVDSAKGGSPRAHVDALRLLAAFLAHWDNKPDNQRLVCVSRQWPDGTGCPEPMLVLQDLGAAFGPRKVDVEGWTTIGIWGARASCQLTMSSLPYGGTTFSDTRVGEPGRQLLLKRLRQMSDAQARDLFVGARFDQKRGLFSDVRPVDDWVRAFKARVAMISDGPACPAL